jgi:hypothetical protein
VSAPPLASSCIAGENATASTSTLLFRVLASGRMFSPPAEDGPVNPYPVRAVNHQTDLSLVLAPLARTCRQPVHPRNASPAERLPNQIAAAATGSGSTRSGCRRSQTMPSTNKVTQMIHKTIAAQSGASSVLAA